MKAWLGLGSNMQQPVARVQEALGQLAAADGVEVLQTSSLYRTPPWGDTRQDDFINAVTAVETDLGPLMLLEQIQLIEGTMGRQRGSRRWGPRVIDIDLLLFGKEEYHSANLDIPHPRMHERAFVLLPLVELDAGLVIPGRGGVNEYLQKLDCSGISRVGYEMS